MNWTLSTPPALEPVSLAEAKTHCRIDGSDDDDYLAGLITAARVYLEEVMRRAFLTQTWRASLDAWPDDSEITLPRAPLQSVISIVYKDSSGAQTTLAETDDYLVDTDSEPGRIVPAVNKNWPETALYPINPIQITYIAGYGDAPENVPATIRQAIRLLVGHWYENREATMSGATAREIPLAVDSLIYMDRM